MYTDITILLDRSGSMQDAKSDHEGGLNSFVEDQKNLDGDVRFTLIQFDDQDPCEIIYDGVPISEVSKFSLLPRGWTPLLDAVGRSVTHTQERLTKYSLKPDLMIFMIITDGQENASKEFTKERVKSLVGEKEREHWKFLFLGANIDSFATGGDIGMGAY